MEKELSIVYYTGDMKKKSSELAKQFGMKVKIERTKRFLSQEKLAEKSNLSFVTINSIENGCSSPTIETVKSIAEAFEIDMKELFDFNY